MESQASLAIPPNVAPLGSPCILNLCSHRVEFYDGDELLVDKVAGFLALGALKGEGVLAIVEPRRIKAIETSLQAKGLNVADAKAKGQLQLCDADEILRTLLNEGEIDSAATQRILGEILTPLQARFTRIHAYGEMVSVLWGKGNARATLQLEREWNTICEKYRISLLCGYAMRSFDREHDRRFIDEIYSLHDRTHKHPTP